MFNGKGPQMSDSKHTPRIILTLLSSCKELSALVSDREVVLMLDVIVLTPVVWDFCAQHIFHKNTDISLLYRTQKTALVMHS